MVKPPPSDSQVFDVPSPLRERIGPRDKEAEVQALARPRRLSPRWSANFGRLDGRRPVKALHSSRRHAPFTAWMMSRSTSSSRPPLNLKGLGATYDFPLVSRLAASLCKLLGDGDSALQGPLPLVDAHVSAIKATVREGARSGSDPTGVCPGGRIRVSIRAATWRASLNPA